VVGWSYRSVSGIHRDHHADDQHRHNPHGQREVQWRPRILTPRARIFFTLHTVAPPAGPMIQKIASLKVRPARRTLPSDSMRAAVRQQRLFGGVRLSSAAFSSGFCCARQFHSLLWAQAEKLSGVL